MFMEDFTINCRELLIKLFNKYRNGEKIQRMLFTSDIEYKEVNLLSDKKGKYFKHYNKKYYLE